MLTEARSGNLSSGNNNASSINDNASSSKTLTVIQQPL